MKKVYLLLMVFWGMAVCRYAGAQPIAVGYDSLKRFLPMQHTAKDSLHLFQQLVDADPTVSLKEPKNISTLLVLNNRLHLIDARPYQMLEAAWQYASSGKTRQALDTTLAAVRLFDKQHKKITALLFNMRLYFNALNDQEGRLKFYQQQLEYYQVNGPYENTAPCYHGIAGYYYYKAEYNLAITNYLLGGEVYRKFNGYFYYNAVDVAASSYVLWGNYERAQYFLQHYVQPLNGTYGKANYNNWVTYYWATLGMIDEHYKRYDKAFYDVAQGIATFKDQKSNTGIYPMLLVHKAGLYLETGQQLMVLPLLKRAQFITDSAKFPISTTQGPLEVDYGYYLYYLSLGQNDKAAQYLQAAAGKATKEHANALRLKYYQVSSDFYENTNQPDLALRFGRRFRSLLDSLNDEESKFKIAQFEIDQNDRAQREHINQLKQQKVIQDYELGRRNLLLIVAGAVILLVVFLLAFIYKQLVVNKKTLISLRQTQRQLIQSEKMASLGELTAGIAHEIQNPLNFVNNFSEVNIELVTEMQTELENGTKEEVIDILEDIKQNLEKISHHGKRADGIVKGMLQHSRASSNQKEPTDLNALADEYLRLAYHGLRAKDKSFNAELITNFDEKLPTVNLVPQDVGRVLVNLLNNAFYATHQKQKTAGANYKPVVEVGTKLENGKAVLRVRDNGSGIAEAVKDKIMQPFFTTKPTGEGTGLGLSLSYDIVVKGHGGTIDVKTSEGDFTEFVITLPIS